MKKNSFRYRFFKLKFSDLLFISFGGQAPFISLLTFGTVMVNLVGTQSSMAMLIATAVVLFNGLVIYFLSRRFKRSGGYYIYAFYSLTSRLGLNTGWNYLIYSLSYGGTLLAGGSYVFYLIISNLLNKFFPSVSVEQWWIVLSTSLLASILVIGGIKISAKYAMIMSLAEMLAMILLSLIFLYFSNWNFYNPISNKITPTLLQAVVFGLGIPTGYASIASLAEEAEEKAIAKASIAVLLLGGLLASLFFYSLASTGFTGKLVDFLLAKFGIIGEIILSFIAINDGILGGMTYILSLSRTIKAMAEDGIFPSFLSKVNKSQKPIYAEFFVAFIFTLVLTLMANYIGIFYTFVTLGALSGLNNIFIHISANMSLIRIASKRAHKHIHEILVAIIATLIGFSVFFYSLPTFDKYIVYMFFGWIILGFLYAEGLEMFKAGSEEKQKV